MHMSYRRDNICKEIIEASPDVVCLQVLIKFFFKICYLNDKLKEVDRYKDFRSGLRGDYDGIFKLISCLSSFLPTSTNSGLFILSEGTEGVAMFWRRDKWYQAASKNINLGEKTVAMLVHLEARTVLSNLH